MCVKLRVDANCGKPMCKTCAHIVLTDTFISHITGQVYSIRQSTNCTSSNSVYLIECRICGVQYVGETGNDVRERMRNHRSTIKHYQKHTDKPVASHFSLPHHSLDDLRLIIIESLGKQSKFRRLHRETFWINTLRSTSPLGLNLPTAT